MGAVRPGRHPEKPAGGLEVYFDAETWGLGGPLALWCAITSTGERWSGTQWDDFLAQLDAFATSRSGANGCRSITVWAHNGGGYDFLLMFPDHIFEVFEGGGLWVGTRLLEGRIQLNSRQQVRFRDTLALFPGTSLEGMGVSLGLPKGATPPDFVSGAVRPLREGDYRYCFRDCEIVRDFLAYFRALLWRERGINPALTIAQTALRDWTTNDLGGAIFTPDLIDDLAGRAYVGGRVETYHRGIVRDLVKYDVNSMYPHVMREGRFPDPSQLVRTGPMAVGDLLPLLDRCEGVVFATVDLQGEPRPPLPVVHDHTLVFPAGTVAGSWCLPEIRYALAKGAEIRSVTEAILAPPLDTSPFRSYVDFWWGIRERAIKSGDPAMKMVAKYMGNALYGKFGQKARGREVPGLFTDAPPFEGAEFTFADPTSERGYWTTPKDKHKRPRHRIVTWAAYITSLARVHLGRLMDQAGEVVYCDTDCLVTPAHLPMDPLALGALKIEANIEEGQFLAPKRYWYRTTEGKVEVAFKGISRPSGIEDRQRFLRVVKPREGYKRGLKPGSPLWVVKDHSLNSHKREWLPDGSSVPRQIEIIDSA